MSKILDIAACACIATRRATPSCPAPFAASLLIGLLLTLGCSDSSGPSGPAPVSSVSLTAPSQTFASLGETIQIAATVKDANGATLSDRTVTWSSSNAAFVSVNSSTGLATAVANGTATITAQSEGKSGTIAITVNQQVATVQITAPADTIRALSDTLRFSASPRDARGNVVAGNHVVTWVSTNNAVASIDATGLATAVTDGAFTIEGTVNAIKGAKIAAVKQRGSAVRMLTEPAGARAGIIMQTQPSVEIVDGKGNRVLSDNASSVAATIQSGGGTLSGTAAITVSNGVATFTNLAVAGLKGARTLRFTAPSVDGVNSQSFTLAAGDPAVLEVVAGGGQAGLANTALANPLAARLRDAFQNGIEQTQLGWERVSGEGQLAQLSSVTDAAGVATMAFTLGLHAGEARIRASLPASALTPVDFLVEATPNATISGTVTLSTSLLGAIQSVSARVTQAKRPTGMSFTASPPAVASRTDLSGPLGLQLREPAQGTAQRTRVSTGAVPGELIVIYRNGALGGVPAAGAAAYRTQATAVQAATTIRSAMAGLEGAGRVRVRGVSPAILAARIEVTNIADTASVAAQLRADPRVLAVERNGVIRMGAGSGGVERVVTGVPGMSGARSGSGKVAPSVPASAAGIDSRLLAHNGTVPNDPLYPFQAWHYNSINMPEAWELSTGSNNVIVAVVDDGIRFDHPGIAANLTSDGFDFVSAGSLPVCLGGSISRTGDGDGIDANPTIPSSVAFHSSLPCITGSNVLGGHGLHVAGTIGAVGNDGASVTGVAWNVRIRPVRVMDVSGSGTNFDIAQGMLYAAGLPADNGSGGIVPPPAQGAHVINLSLGGPGPSITLENALIAVTNAGSLVVAAAGNDGVFTPFFPAAYPQALSVSAVGPDLQLASYSNFGSTIDITAPGGDLGDGGSSFGITSTRWNFQTGSPAVESIQGTSMAAPHVSGVAALLFAANPGISATQVRARLTGFASDLGVAGPDILFGAGLVDARAALSQSFGPSRTTRLRLMNPTGEIVRNLTATAGGGFSFGQLADGQYRLFAGEDRGGDGKTGLPLRRWGAFGGSAVPNTITVDGAATHGANITIGFPFELEPNNTAQLADELPIDGYMIGIVATALVDMDFYRVVVPTAGTYVFETIGVQGACGHALDEDTILTLFNAGGQQIGSNDDLSFSASLLCSRITMSLQPGTYALRVTGYSGKQYVVMARRG